MEDASEGGENGAEAPGAEQRGEVVGVEQILRRRVHLEEREHAGLDARLPLAAREGVAPDQRDRLAEAHRAHVLQIPVVQVVAVRGGEVWPARIRQERLEQVAGRQEPGGQGRHRGRRDVGHDRGAADGGLAHLDPHHARQVRERLHDGGTVGARELRAVEREHAVVHRPPRGGSP